MARIQTENQIDLPVRRGGGISAKFALIEPGYYLAEAVSAETSVYTAKNGKVTYRKLTPEIILLNDNETTINRQDFTIGAVKNVKRDGATVEIVYRPDGNPDKPATFGGFGFLLGALGFVDENDNVDLGSFDPALVCGQIFKVRIGRATYTKSDGETGEKNEITGTYPLDENDVDEYTLHVHDNGMIFRDEAAAQRFEDTLEALIEEEENGVPSPF